MSLTVIAMAAALLAQDPGGQVPEKPPAVASPIGEQKAAAPVAPHFLVRRYPRDKEVVVAVVGSRSISLGDLIDHIDAKHYPGFRDALVRPEIQRMLQSDLMAPWVRQLADLEALRQSLGEVPLDEAKLTAAQSEVLKRNFQSWLDTYVADRRAGGRDLEMTQRRIDSLLADFQLRNGLAAEMQGMLEYLEPDDYSRGQMQAFFNDNARAFGGQVKIAHILVQHRDGGTGLLLADEGVARANARLADIRARLRPDGSNFDEVARSWSDDTRTAPEGGLLGGLHRFDDRMPAAICRAAWQLRDGDVSDVVETQYGWHLLQRIDFNQQIFVLFTDDAIPTIRMTLRRFRQEERLFQARKTANVRLLL